MKKLLLSLSCAIIFTADLDAQLPMTRTTIPNTYNPISLPAATLSTATGDDVAESAIPIGFTFNYLGNNYTTIGVNTNGAASFDAVMSTSGTNINLFATAGMTNTIAPWWDNIYSDTILYQLQGVAPNQTFTIQWTNSFSYSNTATQQLNFQVILYETTNVIEFAYGALVPGVTAQNESASIGLEGTTGGPGNFLDAVTGSAFTGNGMLEAGLEWPTHNFLFTPGAPTAVAGGTYTVGVSGNYFSLSEALADINHRGIAGAVNLSLIDAQYDVTPAGGDNFFPMLLGPVAGTAPGTGITITSASGMSTISSDGAFNGNCANAAANNIISNTNEPVFALVGVSYVTMQNVAIMASPTAIVDRGLMVINSSATLGSQYNSFSNINVTLNRGSNGCYGISQQAITTPTAASGSNSVNIYIDVNISNVFSGIYLNGNAAFPDSACIVGTSSPLIYNMIGASTPNDLGGGVGATASFGVRANNQKDVQIFNCEVRNVTNGGNGTAEGIIVDAGVGMNSVHGNKIHDIAFSGTNTTQVTGIRVSLANVAGAQVNVYNNFVYGLSSGYNGTATATRAVRGIYAQSAGGGNAAAIINVDFNNVLIDNSSAPNLSSTCFESGSVVPVINTRNNVFSNISGAQAGVARHTAMASTSATAIGGAGSVSDYNDLYVANATNGFIGVGATTTYASLANWQTAMTQDASSLSVDPGFFSINNLHISAVALDGAANASTTPWVTTDIDNQPRAITPDIGADEFTPLLLDVSVTALVSPLDSGCHSANEPVVVTLKNYAVLPIDFTTDPVNITVDISGAVTQTLTLMLNNNSINGNVPLASGGSIDIPVGTFNMITSGTYSFDAYCVLTGDGNLINDTLNTVNVDYNAGSIIASTSSVCGGGSVTLTLSGATSTGTIQWQSSTDGGVTWVNETGTGFDSTVYVVIPTDTTMYQVLFCGAMVTNSVNVLHTIVSNPVATNDTVCGPGSVTLSVTGTGTINWYADAVGGTSLQTGNSYSPNVTATDTFYVSNTIGSTTQGVGLYDNSAGGGMSGSANNLIFDVFNNCTLTGVYVYPAAAGTVQIDLVDAGNTVVNTASATVTAGDVGQRTFIPLGFNLTPATGMQLIRNGTSVQLWRNNVGVNYSYAIPGILSITGSTAGAGFYYFFYDWQISFGCESPRVPVEVTVTAPPAISVSLSDSLICAGDSAMITVTSGNAGYTYLWSPAGSLNTSTGASVSATPTVTTTYTVNADDAATGCRAIDSITLNVNAVPAFIASSTDSVICTGSMDTLVVSYPGQSVGEFDNSAAGQQLASANNLIFDVYSNCTLLGVYIYPGAAGNVIIELQDNTNAVINTATYVATAADVNVRTYVPLNFTLTPGTGMQLVRNAASVNCWRSSAGVTYPYDLPGIMSITGSTAGPGFYYYFYDWQVAFPGPHTFSWTSNPIGFTATGDSAFVNPTGTTQYIVTATDTVAGCVAQFTTTISIATMPDVTVTGPASICQGDSALLTATFTGGDGTMSYVWSNSLGTNDSVMVNPSANTTYSVTGTDGCGFTETDSFLVVVTTGIPTAAFTFSPIGNNMFDFVDASGSATSWAWDFGDSQTSTQQNPTHTYATQGSYTVTLIVTNGCGADTITQVVLADGIAEAEEDRGIVLYPNPADEQFAVSFISGTTGFTLIEIYSIDGKLVHAMKLGAQQKGNVLTIDAHTFDAGVYIVKVSDMNGSSHTRMEIQ